MLGENGSRRLTAAPGVNGALFAALLVAITALVDPASTDHANGRFRAFLFDRVGVAPWNNMWLNGHHTPAYSLLTPPVTALVGVWLTGALLLVATPVVFDRVIHALQIVGVRVARAQAATACLTLLAAASMIIGQTAYLMGMVCGLVTVWQLLIGRPLVAGIAALAAGASSPAAGLFLALASAAIAVDERWRRPALAVGAAALFGFLAPMVLFPEGGEYYPFSWGGAANLALLCAPVVIAGRRFRPVMVGAAGYGLLVVLTLAGVTGMGNIVARLATLVAAPLVLMTWQGGWKPLVVVCAGAVAFQWAPVAGVAFADVDPMRDEATYRPLLDVLDGYPAGTRIEVVPVRTHDEADFIPRHFPIARGWHRHLDRRDNLLFYGPKPLTESQYRQWLDDRDVAIVAIADTKLDYGGVKERDLLENPPDYLREIYSDDLWRVWEVVRPVPQAVPVGDVIDVQPEVFTVRFDTAGSLLTAFHFSPWFVVDGPACVRPNDDGWAVVEATEPAVVSVRADLSWRGLFDRNGTC